MVSLNWAGNSSPHQLTRGLIALNHRGPDGFHSYRSPGGHITLGHAQLNIMDPASTQPHSNETGHIHSVVNGEFYGFEHIRATLISKGHHFKTNSDSEILIHLYEEHGTDCIHHLRGEFAFVLWDETNHLLFAARDRFGIKPLFFAHHGETLLIASEVKALHAAGITPAWDQQGFYEKLVLHLPLEGRTLFQSVSEIPAAHCFIAQRNQITQTRYWDFNYPRESTLVQTRSEDDLAAELHAILHDAVNIRTRAAVPIACYLSGGLDSASVLSFMSRKSAKPVEAFCLSFNDPEFDESNLASETAAYLGANLTFVPITNQSLAGSLEATVRACETTFSNAQCVAKFLLSQAVHQAGFRIAITGEGADELFAGYPVFIADCLPKPNLEPTRSAFQQRLGYRPTWHLAQDAFLNSLREILPTDFNAESIRHQFLDTLDIANQLHGRAHLDQSLYLFNQTVLPGHILPTLGDRVEMAHSIEGRLPLLDHHIAEFTRCLPANLKIRGGAEKYLLRKAMRLHVPPAVCGRRKRALQTPPVSEIIHDTIRGSGLDRLPFLNKPAAIQLLNHALSANPQTASELQRPLMTLTTACLLAKTFKLA